MQSIDQLLDAVKVRHGITSDYKLAQFLGLTIGAIGHYRHGRSLPDDRACQKIGEALGIDGDVLAAEMLARRAKDDDTRVMWTRIAHRLGGMAAGVALIAGAVLPPTPASAADSSGVSGGGSVYYVKSRRRRRGAMAFIADCLCSTSALPAFA